MDADRPRHFAARIMATCTSEGDTETSATGVGGPDQVACADFYGETAATAQDGCGEGPETGLNEARKHERQAWHSWV